MTQRTLTKEIIKDIKKMVYFNGFDVVGLICVLEKHNCREEQYLEALEYMKYLTYREV